MKKKIAKYIKLVKELKAYGEEILEFTDDDDWKEFSAEFEEIENMNFHLECCLHILENEDD
jgi:hypothetical protein